MQTRTIKIYSNSMEQFNKASGIGETIHILTINENVAMRFLLRELKKEVEQGKKSYLLNIAEIDNLMTKLKEYTSHDPA
jgi:hypothetical protein